MFKSELERLVLENVTVKQYYSDKIRVLDNKFKYAFDNNSERAICPLHNDTDPSFGLMKDKQNKGVTLYHCFGCGMAGNVIRLHQLISQKYLGVTLTDIEAEKELVKGYNLAIDVEKVDSNARVDDVYTKKVRLMRQAEQLYFARDFDKDVLRMRLSDMPVESKIAQLNRYTVSMIKNDLKKTD